MRKRLALLLLLTMVAPLCGKIMEVANFKELAGSITPSTLLIVDIDDTLLVPEQTIGSDVWFMHRWKDHQAAGLSHDDAKERALAEWEAVRHLTKMRLVEEGSGKVIADLQDKELPIMGLTSQGMALATRTVMHLKSVGIDLSITAPAGEDVLVISSHHSVLYRKGILFTSGSPKGAALTKFFEQIGCHPQRIVFIDDREANLKDVEAAAEAMGIEFIGLRYSHEDKRIASFSKEVGDIQWNNSTFGHLLSDAEAAAVLKKSASSKAAP